VCGFVLTGPDEPCPRCALFDEDVAAAIDKKRTVADVEEWLKGQKQEKPLHPLQAELERLQTTLDALEACPPLWWADKLLWRGLRWFYRMRQRRVDVEWEKSVRQG
jgi:hypothetical protein